MKRNRPMKERLLRRVVAGPNCCWIWTASVDPGGYARIGYKHSRAMMAHRASYQEFVGPIPEGMTLDHLCHVRRCINPAHLEVVTQAENNRRALVRAREIGRVAPLVHGTLAMYRSVTAKCRCDLCRQAIRNYNRDLRSRQGGPKSYWCDDCKRMHRPASKIGRAHH